MSPQYGLITCFLIPGTALSSKPCQHIYVAPPGGTSNCLHIVWTRWVLHRRGRCVVRQMLVVLKLVHVPGCEAWQQPQRTLAESQEPDSQLADANFVCLPGSILYLKNVHWRIHILYVWCCCSMAIVPGS
eukprot:GHUV01039213.1.p2 GENE.GHUV01039213.1~~GHUV01039213.1.p2  ORF type:complete len:130 (-),score=9.17 GHUV01039213.1:230-619(-)